MIYNLVSCRKVISKLMTDLDLQEDTHRVLDMVEWIGEGLKKIGAFPSLTTKTLGKEGLPLLKVESYQAQLPSDLHTINQVAFTKTNKEGPYYSMRYAMGSFSSNHAVTGLPDDGLVSLNNNFQANTETGTVFSYDWFYNIVGGYIKTNLKEGYLMISYQAVPLDTDGYPMVPNDESFLEALYWYINMKLTYPEWKLGKVRDAVYYDAKSSWNYYRKQAYGNAMMPDGDQLESIKNVWIRLIPEINANRSFFSTVGQQELIYNKDWK
jgi:hypothetical protein